MTNATTAQKAVSMRTLQSRNKEEIARRDGFMVSPSLIMEQADFNPRNYQTERTQQHIATIAAAYLAGEFVEPITVRVGDDNMIYIVEGHCRTLAMKEAMAQGWNPEKVKVNVFEGTELDALIHVSTSNNKLPLAPSERARYYKSVIDTHGLTLAELAKRIGKTSAHVGQCLKLLEMPEYVISLIDNKRISAAQAIKTANDYARQARAEAAEDATNEEIKAQGYEQLESALKAIVEGEPVEEAQAQPVANDTAEAAQESASEQPKAKAKAKAKKVTAKALSSDPTAAQLKKITELLRDSAEDLDNMEATMEGDNVTCTMDRSTWDNINEMLAIIKELEAKKAA